MKIKSKEYKRLLYDISIDFELSDEEDVIIANVTFSNIRDNKTFYGREIDNKTTYQKIYTVTKKPLMEQVNRIEKEILENIK